MKRNKDYCSDVVRDSVQETMKAVRDYFDRNWAEGKEAEVIMHVQDTLCGEIDKYLPHGAASQVYSRLSGMSRGGSKYEEYYARQLETYGPYVMELLAEYADSLALAGRYDVGDRYCEVLDAIQDKLEAEFLSDDSINSMLDRVSADMDKFMKQHGIGKYSLVTGTIALAIDVYDDITLVKQDAPRGRFRHEFNKVTGSFICKDCGLTSLQFGPKEVGGDFDCSNNKLTSLSGAPKVVGGNFIWEGNAAQVTYSEIRKKVKVGGRIYTDAPLTAAEKEDFRQVLAKEQKEFLDEYRKVGHQLEAAVAKKDVRKIEECREYFYDAIDFFKERPWLTAQGMKMSYQILMKAYVHLHQIAPEKYADVMEESYKLGRLTDKAKYPDGWNW